MEVFVPTWTFLYPHDLDDQSSLATFRMTFTIFIQIYIFLISNWFPIFVLTVLKNIFMIFYFLIPTVFLFTWQGPLFLWYIVRIFSYEETKFQSSISHFFAVIIHEKCNCACSFYDIGLRFAALYTKLHFLQNVWI